MRTRQLLSFLSGVFHDSLQLAVKALVIIG